MNTSKHPSISKLVAVILLVFLCIIISTSLQAGEKEDYQAARNKDTIEVWDLYLKKYPKGEHAKVAREAHDNLLWNETEKNVDNSTALETIFKRCKTPDVSDKVFKLWDNALWATAKTSDTTEAYRKYILRFPGGQHINEAKGAIEETAWRQCKESDNVESFKTYLKEYPEGTHAKEAEEAVKNLEYQAAREKDTIEGYEEFLKDNDDHKEAGKRLRQLRYERAVKTGTLENWKAYYDEYRHSSWTDDGKEVEQMKDNAYKEIERLLYERITAEPTLELCNDYLNRYSDGLHKQQVMVKMEPFLFDWAKRVNTVESYEEYINRYPNGAHLKEVQADLDPVFFRKAQEEDWYSTYENYINKFPNGTNVQKVRDRIAFLKANKAVVEIEYPKVIEQQASPYFNVSNPFWGWDTVFKEKTGKIGFKVQGSGHIEDPQGGIWGNYGGSIGRGEIKVPAGGAGKDDYWCSSPDHVLCNGYAIFTWTGEDAGGHQISLEEKVKLQHTGCPGAEKKSEEIEQ